VWQSQVEKYVKKCVRIQLILIERIWPSQKFDKLSFYQKCSKINIADKAGSVCHLIGTLEDKEPDPY
jgi:hypothetical protein